MAQSQWRATSAQQSAFNGGAAGRQHFRQLPRTQRHVLAMATASTQRQPNHPCSMPAPQMGTTGRQEMRWSLRAKAAADAGLSTAKPSLLAGLQSDLSCFGCVE